MYNVEKDTYEKMQLLLLHLSILVNIFVSTLKGGNKRITISSPPVKCDYYIFEPVLVWEF